MQGSGVRRRGSRGLRRALWRALWRALESPGEFQSEPQRAQFSFDQGPERVSSAKPCEQPSTARVSSEAEGTSAKHP
eukprot:3274423-Alexandrium_andersonii.AAC.1